MYHIYYLPNAVRKHLPGIKGKVGLSKQTPEKRKCLNKLKGLDVTDHRILVDNISTKEEGKRLEYRYQQILRCIDRSYSNTFSHSDHTKSLMSESRKGRKVSDETREKIRLANIGLVKPKTPCVHCGKEVTAHNMIRWHGDNCRLLKIRVS